MKLSHIPRSLAAGLVSLYQKTLSPDYGFPSALFPHGFCPQHPTCSAYAKQMILERGAVIGGALALKRVLSCHPWRTVSDQKLRKLAETELQKS